MGCSVSVSTLLEQAPHVIPCAHVCVPKKSKKSTMKVLLLLTAAIRQFAAGTPNLITS